MSDTTLQEFLDDIEQEVSGDGCPNVAVVVPDKPPNPPRHFQSRESAREWLDARGCESTRIVSFAPASDAPEPDHR